MGPLLVVEEGGGSVDVVEVDVMEELVWEVPKETLSVTGATTPVMNVEQVVRRIIEVAFLASRSPSTTSANIRDASRDLRAVITYLSLIERRETERWRERTCKA